MDRPCKRFISAALGCLLLSSLAAALSPIALKELVDLLGNAEPRELLFGTGLLVLLYTGAEWLARSFGELQGMLLGRADRRLHRLLSEGFLRHILALPISICSSHTTGGLCQTLANGLRGYSVILHHMVNSILPLAVEFVAIAFILVALSQPVFVVIIAASFLCFAALIWIAAIRMQRPSIDASSAQVDAGAMLTDVVMNFENMKRLCAEEDVARRFEDLMLRVEASWRRLYDRRMENGLGFSVVFSAALGLTAYVAMRKVEAGSMSIGEFVLVNAYVVQVTRPVQRIGLAARDIVQGLAFVQSMAAVMSLEREPAFSGGTSDVALSSADIGFHRVSLAYEIDKPVLRDLDFVIHAGQTVAIVGPSGSGKSSIVRLLLRLVDPTAGEIRIGSTPLASISVSTVRKAIAVIPQDTILLNDTIGNNISLGRSAARRKDVISAAMAAGVHDFIETLPLGYDTTVGERGLRLSGGERQRIAIARAAIRDPSVLVFDEATASLDRKSGQAIMENMRRRAVGVTTVLIAHSLGSVAHADQTIVLDRGTVVEKGRHEELLAQRGIYAAMWRAQLPAGHGTGNGCLQCAG